MTNEEMRTWIDNASYEDLLSKWRFAAVSDPFFQGEIGLHFAKMIRQRFKNTLDPVAASKRVGWED